MRNKVLIRDVSSVNDDYINTADKMLVEESKMLIECAAAVSESVKGIQIGQPQ